MKRLLQCLMILAVVVPLLSSCGAPEEPAPECVANGECDTDQACINGVCRVVECFTSSDCDTGQFCSDKFACLPGCAEDTDCLAGEVCDAATATCEPRSCRTTVLDCSYGEVCNESTGACELADGPYCEPCNAAGPGNECGAGADCYYFEGDQPQDGWCFVGCNPQAEDACPRGYQCADVTGAGDFYCWADCPWLEDEGYLQ